MGRGRVLWAHDGQTEGGGTDRERARIAIGLDIFHQPSVLLVEGELYRWMASRRGV